MAKWVVEVDTAFSHCEMRSCGAKICRNYVTLLAVPCTLHLKQAQVQNVVAQALFKQSLQPCFAFAAEIPAGSVCILISFVYKLLRTPANATKPYLMPHFTLGRCWQARMNVQKPLQNS